MPLSTQPQNILVIRGGAVGDFVLTIPVLLSLRSGCPGAVLSVAGHPDRIELAADLVDRVLDIDAADWAPLFSDAPGSSGLTDQISRMDLIVSYLPDRDGIFTHNLLQSCGGQVIAHAPHPPDDGSVHVIDHLLSALRPLDIACVPTPAIPAAQSPIDAPYIVMHPGSGGKHKIWPSERYAEVGKAFETTHSIVITSGPADRDAAAALARRLPSARVIVPETLPELASILGNADLFVGNDSGPTHIAAATGTATVAIFGPTDPRTWGPRGECVEIVAAPDGVPTFDRLLSVSVSQVLESSRRLISQET